MTQLFVDVGAVGDGFGDGRAEPDAEPVRRKIAALPADAPCVPRMTGF